MYIHGPIWKWLASEIDHTYVVARGGVKRVSWPPLQHLPATFRLKVPLPLLPSDAFDATATRPSYKANTLADLWYWKLPSVIWHLSTQGPKGLTMQVTLIPPVHAMLAIAWIHLVSSRRNSPHSMSACDVIPCVFCPLAMDSIISMDWFHLDSMDSPSLAQM